jgi:hypothetical protein
MLQPKVVATEGMVAVMPTVMVYTVKTAETIQRKQLI